jgi:hypothetical protein
MADRAGSGGEISPGCNAMISSSAGRPPPGEDSMLFLREAEM